MVSLQGRVLLGPGKPNAHAIHNSLHHQCLATASQRTALHKRSRRARAACRAEESEAKGGVEQQDIHELSPWMQELQSELGRRAQSTTETLTCLQATSEAFHVYV
jgi:hypothetical protein